MKKKSIIALICGVLAGFALVMAYLNRGLILSLLTGEEMADESEDDPSSLL